MNRPIHSSLPRRPARTSQCEQSHSSEVIEFSRVTLRSGIERTIAGLIRRSVPTVAIAHWREGRLHGRTLVLPDNLEIVAFAVSTAREPNFIGRRDAGELPSTSMAIRVWTRRWTDGRTGVLFGRVHTDGSFIGSPTTITGAELDALESALEWLGTELSR